MTLSLPTTLFTSDKAYSESTVACEPPPQRVIAVPISMPLCVDFR